MEEEIKNVEAVITEQDVPFEQQIESLIEEVPAAIDAVEVGVHVMDIEEIQELLETVKSLSEKLSSVTEELKAIRQTQEQTRTDIASTQKGITRFGDYVVKSLKAAVTQEVVELATSSTHEKSAAIEHTENMKKTRRAVPSVFPENAPGG